MTREEIIDKLGIEEPVIFFDPSEVYDKGILGISEDHCHLIYGYFTLASVLAEEYKKEWESKEHKEDEEEPDFYSDACEWLDYNTVRTAEYLQNENYPIVIYELTE